MDDRTARLFSGLGLLVVVWIVVYWTWPVREPVVTTSLDDAGLGPISGGSAVEPEPAEPLDPEPAGRAAAPTRRVPDAEAGEPRRAEAEEGPGVIPPEFTEYVVQSGDDFMVISRKVYGTTDHWDAIARSNFIDPRKLRVGQTIRVPVDPNNVQGLDGDGEGPPPAPEPEVIEYTVKRGDTLSGIAKSFYGSVGYVDFLYEANRGRLRSRDDLRLGQVLLIPPLPDGAD